MTDLREGGSGGEQEARGPEFRPLRLPCGRSLLIDSRLYPQFSEWDWYHDPETLLTVRRTQDAKIVRAYDEMVRFNRGSGDSFGFPVLTRGALRKMFSHYPAYRAFTIYSSRQRAATEMEAMPLPGANEYLSLALSYALTRYFVWLEEPRKVFTPDADNLTPGKLEEVKGRHPTYRTLGEWMDAEYTGAWWTDEDAFTGIRPERIADRLDRGMIVVWRLALSQVNVGRHKVPREDVEEVLTMGKVPVIGIAAHALSIIRSYTLPE